MRYERYDLDGTLLSVEETPPTSDEVDAERDRRQSAGFDFAGKRFQSDPASREKIMGAALMAQFAVARGAQPGDPRWGGGDQDFTWIAEDNTAMTLDAQGMISLAIAAGRHHEAIFRVARALKDMTEIPTDFADDRHWP